jgi:hypothetical protein
MTVANRSNFKTIVPMVDSSGFGSFATTAGSGGSGSIVADGNPFGGASLLWGSPTPSDSSRIDYNAPASFNTSGGIGIWIKDSNNYSTPNVVQVYLADNSGFSNWMYGIARVAYNGYNLDNWKLYWITAGKMIVGGGSPVFDTTNWNVVRVTVRCGSGGTNAVVSTGPIITMGASTPEVSKFCFTTDDGYETDFSQVYAKFQQHGLKSSHFIIPQLLDTASWISTTKVKQMYADGFDICTHDSERWTVADQGSYSALVSRIRDQINRNLDLGFERSARYVAYAEGAYDEMTPAACEEAGALMGFRTGFDPQTNWPSIPHTKLDQVNKYEAPRVFMQNSIGTFGSHARDMVTDMVGGGCTVVTGAHEIGPGGGDWTQGAFDSLMDTATTGLGARHNAGEIEVATLSEAFPVQEFPSTYSNALRTSSARGGIVSSIV